MKTVLAFSNTLTLYPFGKSQLQSSGATNKTFLTFEEFTPTPMKENEIAPPKHVWDNIAQILDQQDRQRFGQTMKSVVQTPSAIVPTKKYIYGSVLIGLVAIALWYLVRA